MWRLWFETFFWKAVNIIVIIICQFSHCCRLFSVGSRPPPLWIQTRFTFMVAAVVFVFINRYMCFCCCFYKRNNHSSFSCSSSNVSFLQIYIKQKVTQVWLWTLNLCCSCWTDDAAGTRTQTTNLPTVEFRRTPSGSDINSSALFYVLYKPACFASFAPLDKSSNQSPAVIREKIWLNCPFKELKQNHQCFQNNIFRWPVFCSAQRLRWGCWWF